MVAKPPAKFDFYFSSRERPEIDSNMSQNEYSKEDIERMRRKMDDGGETALDRIKRKAKEEPLVPAGKLYAI